VESLASNSKLKPQAEEPLMFEVEDSGEYRLFVDLSSPGTDLAQTSCNVVINDQTVGTAQTNGTEGKTVKQKLPKVELAKGVYELRIEFTKPGIVIESVEFSKVD